jgi:exopolyphosphatase/guanosine-5'-triphosphate,3'-diphosphate pyrophosphatase
MTTNEHVTGFIDIGTNSVRMLIVRLNPNRSYTVLSQQKEMVRLGEKEFKEHILQPDAMNRTVVVCRKFMELARAYGAEEYIAVATSAVREAKNQKEFLSRLKNEAQIDVRVISGKEEARLIYLGVSSSVHMSDCRALFVDIGGGSTEIVVGDQNRYHYMASLKLGSIRLTTLFFQQDETNPIASERYARMQQCVRNIMASTVQKVRQLKVDMAIGSSGTIMNLADIASRSYNNSKDSRGVLTYNSLKRVISMLCSLPLKDRRKVPGINPDRADIIIGGAVILDTLMEQMGLAEISISKRDLLDGLLIDYLSRTGRFSPLQMSVRERSVLQLGRSCTLDEKHAHIVAALALELFDSGRIIGLHNLGQRERELLKYAAFLHDIGDFISFSSHHVHSYYIIKNAGLCGFNQREIAIIANVARFHRKKLPQKKSPNLTDLDKQSRKTVIVLSTLLRIAESLDRSHSGLVLSSRFRFEDREKTIIEIIAAGDCQLEIWGVESHMDAFEKAFDGKLILEVKTEEIGSEEAEKRNEKKVEPRLSACSGVIPAIRARNGTAAGRMEP